jgi:serine/threonine protein kinase
MTRPDQWWHGDGLPRSLKADDKSRKDFHPIAWRLLGIANVERRDITQHTDRVRYTAIGLFMVLFSLYAFGGWLAFLSSAGIGELGRYGWVISVCGALLGAGATLAFDRVLVGTTKPALDYNRAPDEDSDAPELDRDLAPPLEGVEAERGGGGPAPLPSIVARPSAWPILARLLIAIVIGAFTTQAIDLMLFGDDINQQRASEQVAAKQGDLNALRGQHQKEVRAHVAATKAAEAKKREAIQRQLDAMHATGNVCHKTLPDSNEPSRCWSAAAAEREARKELEALGRDDPANPRTPSGKKFVTAQGELVTAIDKLRTDHSHAKAAGSGPADETKALLLFVWKNPAAMPLYGAVLILALLLDLAAILLKVTGFDSVYERRQALRSWRSWWETSSLEDRELAAERRALRSERREARVEEHAEHEAALTEIERVATEQRVIRTAYAKAEEDPEIRQEAEDLALDDLHERVRGRARGAQPGGARAPGDGGDETDPPVPPPWHGALDPYYEGAEIRGERRWVLVKPVKVQGGHATVWEAHLAGDPTTKAAIKVMEVAEPSQDGRQNLDPQSERARNDLKWLLSFVDPRYEVDRRHLVELADHGASDGVIWHATWWAAHNTLHDYYASKRPRALVEILEFARQTLTGLKDAANLKEGDPVHADLKPANVLVDEPRGGLPDGVPRLRVADWGLAQEMGDPPGVGHVKIATVGFAAPEMLTTRRNASVNVLDDLFSLGAVLWWCFTCEAPGVVGLARGDFLEYVEDVAAQRRALPPLHELDAQIPVEISEFVRDLLSEARQDRCRAIGVRPDKTAAKRDVYLNAALDRVRELLALTVEVEHERGGAILIHPIRLQNAYADQLAGRPRTSPPTEPYIASDVLDDDRRVDYEPTATSSVASPPRTASTDRPVTLTPHEATADGDGWLFGDRGEPGRWDDGSEIPVAPLFDYEQSAQPIRRPDKKGSSVGERVSGFVGRVLSGRGNGRGGPR